MSYGVIIRWLARFGSEPSGEGSADFSRRRAGRLVRHAWAGDIGGGVRLADRFSRPRSDRARRFRGRSRHAGVARHDPETAAASARPRPGHDSRSRGGSGTCRHHAGRIGHIEWQDIECGGRGARAICAQRTIAENPEDAQAATEYDRLRLYAIKSQRDALEELRRNGTIGDEAYHRLEEEIDWSELAASPAGRFQPLTTRSGKRHRSHLAQPRRRCGPLQGLRRTATAITKLSRISNEARQLQHPVRLWR